MCRADITIVGELPLPVAVTCLVISNERAPRRRRMPRAEHVGVDFKKLLIENPFTFLTCGEAVLLFGPERPGADKGIKHGEFIERLVRGRCRTGRLTAEHENCEPDTARRKCRSWRGHVPPQQKTTGSPQLRCITLLAGGLLLGGHGLE